MHNQPKQESLLSNHTILILSFFLIGMVVGRMLEAEMYTSGILTALFGMTAFIGLEFTSRKRKMKKEQTEELQFVSQLQSRIHKILLHESSVSMPKLSHDPSRNSVQQYVTVAQSTGKRLRPQQRSKNESGSPHFFRHQ